MLNICDRVMGIVVNSVSEVVTLSPEQIKTMPEIGAALGSGYLIRVGAPGERMLTLGDIGRLMSSKAIGPIALPAA